MISLDITNANLPIAVFVKKNEYGPAKLNIKNFNLNDSKKIYLVDDKSKLIIDGVNYTGSEPGQ